ncbi:MAG: sigma-54-dependent Fis family transcriptional regulator, partial [Syntrophomonadaceae bacterium]|nr:sigma-54-dependent Fis family transcriptional regulator [Syntrophomonadaceae bacterium]
MMKKSYPQPISNRYELMDTWEKVHKGSIPSNIHISKEIQDSWKRSKFYGVDPYKKTNTNILDEYSFKQRLEANKSLLNLTIPAMEALYSITKGSGFCITIADKDGYILKRIGDEDELAFTAYSNFKEGANWSEEVMGTNAVGLVLIYDRPIQVFGYEHYCKCACTSTCSAAPIHDLSGKIIGVLDLTGPYKLVNAHTLGMVEASAKAIEREMELSDAYYNIRLANLQKKAIIESISEGLFAVDQHGKITHINKRASDLLEIKIEDCLNKNIHEVLPADNIYFFNTISSGRTTYGETMLIKTNKEKKKFMVNCTPLKDQRSSASNGVVVILHELHAVVNKIIGNTPNITFDSLIGESTSFKSALAQARIAAETDSNILLIGESGTGKDLFAQAIHNASNRRKETFLAINCAAIPRELISSELFGYEEGAFTGARRGGNPGKFELADQGTIFLDEIGEMPLDLQASLLRVLEEKNIIRLGGKEFIPINVRVISATNKDLEKEIKKGNFRHDLFFRLRVVSINIPPLRERKGDIPILAEHFAKSIGSRIGKNINKI